MSKLTKFRRWALEDRYLDDWGGPPNNQRGISIVTHDDVHEDSVGRPGRAYRYKHTVYGRFLNDAFEFWIGETYEEGNFVDDRWKWHCKTEVFRKLALWYLWRWAWGEWFGLRRKLFYWFLHRDVVRMNTTSAPE